MRKYFKYNFKIFIVLLLLFTGLNMSACSLAKDIVVKKVKNEVKKEVKKNVNNFLEEQKEEYIAKGDEVARQGIEKIENVVNGFKKIKSDIDNFLE